MPRLMSACTQLGIAGSYQRQLSINRIIKKYLIVEMFNFAKMVKVATSTAEDKLQIKFLPMRADSNIGKFSPSEIPLG